MQEGFHTGSRTIWGGIDVGTKTNDRHLFGGIGRNGRVNISMLVHVRIFHTHGTKFLGKEGRKIFLFFGTGKA
jgi:hypothetical protein